MGNVRDGEYEGLLANGITPLLLGDTKSTSKIASDSRVQTVDVVDFATIDLSALVKRIEDLYSEHRFSSILNFREIYVKQTSEVCTGTTRFRGFHRNVENALDKQRQRQLYNRSPNPDLPVASRLATFEELACASGSAFEYPFVVKPANLYSSLFVSVIRNEADLRQYLRTDVPRLISYEQDHGTMVNGVLIEEFLEGSNHSIDCAVGLAGEVMTFPIVDVITGRDLGYRDFHHFARYCPSLIDEDPKLQARCHQLARDAVRALELRGTFAHVEFIRTPIGPRILEVGARPGGNRIHVLRNAWGIHMDVAYHRALSGVSPPKTGKSAIPFGIATPFPRRTMQFTAVHRLAEISQIPGFVRSYTFVKPGDMVGPAAEGFQNAVYFEFRRDTVAQLRASLLAVAGFDIYEDE
ncbi:ATP-grasp domain-containing protein [Xylophilus ampelinus]|uniref:ATP-grasp domain-containing protein n=1 Tax=Xylophilus ampelinus TaxID=54067 RepID=A0A318SFP0_9BURK|nr:ATP-grasp domain-containing protein [Xylophilus ampelinus]MCS4510899.1 ATP-grasp domain-containing protein [Xylophilus ampelinus]PYE76058.1 ATP-grasp domain-containing protein [Xylophilus ampelinus]